MKRWVEIYTVSIVTTVAMSALCCKIKNCTFSIVHGEFFKVLFSQSTRNTIKQAEQSRQNNNMDQNKINNQIPSHVNACRSSILAVHG